MTYEHPTTAYIDAAYAYARLRSFAEASIDAGTLLLAVGTSVYCRRKPRFAAETMILKMMMPIVGPHPKTESGTNL
jgi:hypothetical protein